MRWGFYTGVNDAYEEVDIQNIQEKEVKSDSVSDTQTNNEVQPTKEIYVAEIDREVEEAVILNHEFNDWVITHNDLMRIA